MCLGWHGLEIADVQILASRPDLEHALVGYDVENDTFHLLLTAITLLYAAHANSAI
jgi:hypothetical protein